MKAATVTDRLSNGKNAISIHAAREGGDPLRRRRTGRGSMISIHAAREGGDPIGCSTCFMQVLLISIHAAREGGDAVAILLLHLQGYFNPRRP